MHFPACLLAGLALLARALAAPGTKCGGASASQPEPEPEQTPTPTPTEPWRKWCEPGQLCDCSRIADKNSDEYFQCVTNPDCERCWMNAPWTTRTTAITPRTVTRATTTTTDFRTMAPGTYTVSASNTVSVIIVPGPASTSSSSSSSSSSAKPRVITVVETTVVTVPATAADTSTTTSSGDAAATAKDGE